VLSPQVFDIPFIHEADTSALLQPPSTSTLKDPRILRVDVTHINRLDLSVALSIFPAEIPPFTDTDDYNKTA
jgi:hypothetical protein